MHPSFQVRYEKNDAALRVWPAGAFDGNAAMQLHDVLLEQYAGQPYVFIDTAALHDVAPQDGTVFRERMLASTIPPQHLIFKGDHGLALAPEGSRVVVRREKKKHVCCGRCANCTCGHDKPHH